MPVEQVLARFRLRMEKKNVLAIAAVTLLALGWLLNTPAGLLGKADAVGYAVCHRIDLRSFHLGERQLPLCARCTGMYLGAVLGLAFQVFRSPRHAGMPAPKILVILGAMVFAFAVDGINSFLSLIPIAPHLYEPQNWLRLLTGTGMGLVIAAVLYPGFNQAVWARFDPRPALDTLRIFLVLVGLALLVDLAVLSGNLFLVYPLALLSAAGVLLILILVYSMVIIVMLRSENRFTSIRQMVLPLVGGLGLALLQIAVLDLARYWFTGTWDGFHLG
jgi:uncharacterized membrane protein